MTTPRDAAHPAGGTLLGAAAEVATAAASPAGVPAAATPGSTRAGPPDRSGLMRQHGEARARREAAPLGSDAYRAASEEVTRIEVAIATLEEPSPSETAPEAAATA